MEEENLEALEAAARANADSTAAEMYLYILIGVGALFLITTILQWGIFGKAGKPGLTGAVPFVNISTMLQIKPNKRILNLTWAILNTLSLLMAVFFLILYLK